MDNHNIIVNHTLMCVINGLGITCYANPVLGGWTTEDVLKILLYQEYKVQEFHFSFDCPQLLKNSVVLSLAT